MPEARGLMAEDWARYAAYASDGGACGDDPLGVQGCWLLRTVDESAVHGRWACALATLGGARRTPPHFVGVEIAWLLRLPDLVRVGSWVGCRRDVMR